MIMKIFAIRDSAVEAFLQPFFSPTMGSAIRSVTEACNDPKHDFHRNAKDFSLWLLGEFDDSDGQIVSTSPPKALINCVELLNKG